MIRLANVEYPVHYGNVIVFRGWSTLLFPVRASPDFARIQWHFMSCDEPDDPRLTDALSSIRHIPNWKDCSLDLTRKARSFLGYCSSAEIYLGAKSFETQTSDDKSGARVEQSRMFWQKKVGTSMGTPGMGVFGVTAAGELGLTRTQTAHMKSRDSFDRGLNLSQRTPVPMYDVARSTAWLVPELNVVLHVVRS